MPVLNRIYVIRDYGDRMGLVDSLTAMFVIAFGALQLLLLGLLVTGGMLDERRDDGSDAHTSGDGMTR